jgi:glycerophosphoryl diester phosphodiesterase
MESINIPIFITSKIYGSSIFLIFYGLLLSSLDVDFYTINQNILSEKFIRDARRNEREVWIWTVNIERNIKKVLKYDIHGIITDYPEKVQKLIDVNF